MVGDGCSQVVRTVDGLEKFGIEGERRVARTLARPEQKELGPSMHAALEG